MRKRYKYGLLVMLLINIVLISSFITTDSEIKPIGEYQGIIIGSSKLNEVKKILGRKYEKHTRTISLHFRNRPNDEYRTFHQVIYPKIGITLNFFGANINKEFVSQILFNQPFQATTDKGIKLGQSKLKDVIARYGEGCWNPGSNFYSRKLSITYKGITFRTNKQISSDDISKIDKSEYMDLPVTEIELDEIK